MLGETADAELEARANDHLITYAPQIRSNRAGITKATIMLSRDDLDAIEQTFTLQKGRDARLRFVKTSYEWKPANTVAPAVFDPNVELTAVATNREPYREISTETNTNTNTTDQPAANSESVPATNIATAALEVEVVEALNNAEAFLGEQMLVPDTVIFQQLSQHQPIKLRPPRTGDAAHVAEEVDLVLTEQLEEIVESV